MGVFHKEQDTVLFLKEKEGKGNMKSLATSTQERTFCLYWEKVGNAKVKVSRLFLLSSLLGLTAHSWQSLCFLGHSILGVRKAAMAPPHRETVGVSGSWS